MLSKKNFAWVALMITAPTYALTPTELTAHLQQPSTVQGQFVQQRYLKNITKPMQTSGEFALKKQVGLYWHVQKTWRNSSQSGQAAQVKLFMAVLGGDTQELAKQFNLSVSGSLKNWTLTLQPKTAIMKQVFENISIQGDQVVRQVQLREKQGDRTVMIFQNPKINQTLNPSAESALK